MQRKIMDARKRGEPNRWNSPEPTVRVSEWLDRFRAAGFDGIDLMQRHALGQPEEELEKLERATPPVLPSSYCPKAISYQSVG